MYSGDLKSGNIRNPDLVGFQIPTVAVKTDIENVIKRIIYLQWGWGWSKSESSNME